MVKGITWCPT